MKKSELVYREILYNAIEKRIRILTQAELSRNLKISLSTVNNALRPLVRMGAVEVMPRNFHVVNVKKILYLWANARNLQKDIVYATRVDFSVKSIEKLMPDDVVFAAYSAYKFLFNDVPADYSEVYVYGDDNLRKRFPATKGPFNLFVLKKDAAIQSYGKKTTMANTFVDLWNLREWYAEEFVKALEGRMHGILE